MDTGQKTYEAHRACQSKPQNYKPWDRLSAIQRLQFAAIEAANEADKPQLKKPADKKPPAAKKPAAKKPPAKKAAAKKTGAKKS